MAPATPSTHRPSRAAVDWAESGALALTGHADGPPLLPPGSAATRARQLTALIEAAAGCGSLGVDGARLLTERAAMLGLRRRGRISAGGACRLLPTADGWAAVSCARPDDPDLLGALIGGAVSAADPWPAVAAWARGHAGAELAERAALLGLAAGTVDPRADADPYASTPTSPQDATYPYIRDSTDRATPIHPPTSDIADWAASVGKRSGAGALRPHAVEGLLVVDFSALWAGPLCAHLLGAAGARVVKVETPSRPDGARRGSPDFYDLLHYGHESVVLDPADAGGRRALAALVDAADIVIEASRPRALAGFGLDAEAAVARGAVWVSITAAGRASPRVGFGDDVAASAGLVARDGEGLPVFVGDAIADPLTGLTAAALAMTRPTDGGVLWDVAMTDVVAATLAPRPRAEIVRRGGDWCVDAGAGAVPVSAPTPRTPTGRASASGADTASVLASLRITAP
ncbi:CoA transferase [Nocardia takedensis]